MDYGSNIFRTPIESCLNTALGNMPYRYSQSNQWAFHCWPQTWGSTTCGFPGMGGASMCTAITMVVICPEKAICFHNGRWAHEFDLTDDEERADFDKFFIEKNMPAVGDYRTKRRKQQDELSEKVKEKMAKKPSKPKK